MRRCNWGDGGVRCHGFRVFELQSACQEVVLALRMRLWLGWLAQSVAAVHVFRHEDLAVC